MITDACVDGPAAGSGISGSNGDNFDKPKRKRIVKTSTVNNTEDGEVMHEKAKPETKIVKRHEPVADKRKPVKQVEDEEEDLHPITEEETTVPSMVF